MPTFASFAPQFVEAHARANRQNVLSVLSMVLNVAVDWGVIETKP